jgi:hypothetical protein
VGVGAGISGQAEYNGFIKRGSAVTGCGRSGEERRGNPAEIHKKGHDIPSQQGAVC